MSESEQMKAYKEARADYFELVRRAKAISIGSAGLPSDGNRMFWASVLFTRLVVTGISIQRLLPTDDPGDHWDYSAVASITRNLAECHFVLFYLCFDVVDKQEEDARFLIMHLHDNRSRHRMLTELGDSDEQAFQDVKQQLTDRISQNQYFQSLPEKRQRELVRGDKTPFVQDELLDKMEVEKSHFRGLYRLFSAHTHTGPVSYYRNADAGSGVGVMNDKEAVYLTIALRFATDVLQRSIEGMLKIFPYAEKCT